MTGFLYSQWPPKGWPCVLIGKELALNEVVISYVVIKYTINGHPKIGRVPIGKKLTLDEAVIREMSLYMAIRPHSPLLALCVDFREHNWGVFCAESLCWCGLAVGFTSTSDVGVARCYSHGVEESRACRKILNIMPKSRTS